MQHEFSKCTLSVVFLACIPTAMALEQQACQERLIPVDERIASGKYPAQNVQIAQQMRDSILQSCAYLDEGTVAQMMEGFEELLPTKSQAERDADREAKRAERAAQREVQRAEMEAKRAARAERERNRVVVEKPPVSEVLKRPPTATSLSADFVDREDGNYSATVKDWDFYRGKARILYTTTPSNEQYALGNSKHHFYVIESDAEGKVTQRHVTDTANFGLMAAGLRRNHDELILQWQPSREDLPPIMERWSIADGELLSSESAPASPWGHYDQFRLSTSDGNVLFVSGLSSHRKRSSISWWKSSPEGEVLARGTLQLDVGDLSTLSWFHTPSGGGGLVVLELAKTDVGIDSELAPIVQRIGSDEITAVVGSETRLLVTSDAATQNWKSPAISRSFMWQGLRELGPITTNERQAELAKIMVETDRDHGGSISLVNDTVAPIGDGYGVLVKNGYRNDVQPPVNGNWLYEYGLNGDVRETYLHPAAEHLGVGFLLLAASDEDSVFLYARAEGGEQPYVVLLDENREITAYGKALISQRITPDGFIAAQGGVWLFGNGRTDDGLRRIWLERIEF